MADTFGLNNLVLIWDDNDITIDSGTDTDTDTDTDDTFSEDVRARYRAYGWRVFEIDTRPTSTPSRPLCARPPSAPAGPLWWPSAQ